MLKPMRKLLTFTLSLAALPALAALQAGANAPMFEAPAALAGNEIQYSLKSELAKGPVVVYFYPSAYTQGCNIQAHTFSTNMEKFNAAGATVVGVSLDSIARLKDFSADPEYCAGKLPVASDAGGAIAKSFELMVAEGRAGFKDTRGNEIDHGFAERTTFVVTPDGKIAATIGGREVTPTDNVMKALAAVEALKQ